MVDAFTFTLRGGRYANVPAYTTATFCTIVLSAYRFNSAIRVVWRVLDAPDGNYHRATDMAVGLPLALGVLISK